MVECPHIRELPVAAACRIQPVGVCRRAGGSVGAGWATQQPKTATALTPGRIVSGHSAVRRRNHGSHSADVARGADSLRRRFRGPDSPVDRSGRTRPLALGIPRAQDERERESGALVADARVLSNGLADPGKRRPRAPTTTSRRYRRRARPGRSELLQVSGLLEGPGAGLPSATSSASNTHRSPSITRRSPRLPRRSSSPR